LKKLQYIDPDKNLPRTIKKPLLRQIAKSSAPSEIGMLSQSPHALMFLKWYHFLLERGQKKIFCKFAISCRQFTNAIRLQDKKPLMHVSINSYQAGLMVKICPIGSE